jgi:hypothetical protein
MQAPDRRAVNAAERQADALLAADPLGNGRPVSEGLYRLDVGPLVVLYEVDVATRTVEVTGVGLLP